MKTEKITKFEYTNTCTCTFYDPDSESYTELPADNCYGDCWEYVLEDFENIASELFDNNETGWWKVKGIQLWNGTIGGYFHAYKAEDLLKGMGVDSVWVMRGEIFNDRIEYSLSHHDAPMGSRSVVYPVTEKDREEFGLY